MVGSYGEVIPMYKKIYYNIKVHLQANLSVQDGRRKGGRERGREGGKRVVGKGGENGVVGKGRVM